MVERTERGARRLTCALLAGLAVGCLDPSSPGSGSGHVSLVIQRPAASTASTIDSADILILRESGAVAEHVGAAFAEDADTMLVSFSLALLADAETFTLVFTLLGGGEAVYADTSAFVARRGEVSRPSVAAVAAWTADPAITSGPAPRQSAGFVAAPGLGGFILVGGEGLSGDFSDAWLFNGTTWQQLPSLPAGRRGHAVGYHPVRRRVLVFGGRTGNSPPDNATYVFDGTNWVGGTSSDPQAPTARSGAAMAYNAESGELLMFGGFGAQGPGVDAAYLWNGTSWRFAGGAGPPHRSGHSMVYDPDAGRIIVFGGAAPDGTPLNDTWSFKGFVWTALTSARTIPGRAGHTAIYHGARRAMVVVSGAAGNTLLDDVWELRGAEWATAGSLTRPAARAGAVFAFMSADAGALYLLGLGETGLTDDVWRYR